MRSSDPKQKPAAGTVEVWGIMQCGTTRKAMKFLEGKKVPFTFKNLREVAVPKTLLRDALRSVEHNRKIFNVSGASYRDGGWKDKVDTMTKEELISALVKDPMLIKRPIVRGSGGISVGFNEDAIAQTVQ